MYLCVAHHSVCLTLHRCEHGSCQWASRWVLAACSPRSGLCTSWPPPGRRTTRLVNTSHFLFPQASLSNRDFFLWEIWVTVLHDALLSLLFNSGDKTVCYQHFIFRFVIFQEIHGDNAFLLSEQFIVVQFIIMLISHCLWFITACCVCLCVCKREHELHLHSSMHISPCYDLHSWQDCKNQ